MKMKAIPRKRLDTKTSTLTLQDARLPCDKRMAYAADGGGLDAEPAIRFPDRKGLDAEPAIRLLGRKGLNAEPAIRLSDRKDYIQNQAP